MSSSADGGRTSILTFIDWYVPGVKGGGPIRTLANMVEHLPEYRFRIITRDRDLGDSEPYRDVPTGKWCEVNGAQVLYLPPARMAADLAKIVEPLDFDCYYLNSYFSPLFTILPSLLRKLRRLPRHPWVIAPRGEFSTGAFRIKYTKKASYVRVARVLGLHRDVIWQASSEFEEEDIRRTLGKKERVVVAPDLGPTWKQELSDPVRPQKEVGRLRVIFLSRISEKKNLDGALKMLQQAKGDIDFHIYGPIEDTTYWERCQGLFNGLPPNVKVEYCGEVEHAEVRATFGRYHLFLFPTHGENFGHVILESLAAGCPLLLSDQTPWRELQDLGIGWDLPLGSPDGFRQALTAAVALDAEAFGAYSAAATTHAERVLKDAVVVEQNRNLFRQAIAIPENA